MLVNELFALIKVQVCAAQCVPYFAVELLSTLSTCMYVRKAKRDTQSSYSERIINCPGWDSNPRHSAF